MEKELPPQQAQKPYKPEMLYPFDHGTITKVQPRAPRPFLLSGLSLYMYTPLLSSRVRKRVNYLSLFRLLIKEGYVLAT